jgi:hypothetical protein
MKRGQWMGRLVLAGCRKRKSHSTPRPWAVNSVSRVFSIVDHLKRHGRRVGLVLRLIWLDALTGALTGDAAVCSAPIVNPAADEAQNAGVIFARPGSALSWLTRTCTAGW